MIKKLIKKIDYFHIIAFIYANTISKLFWRERKKHIFTSRNIGQGVYIVRRANATAGLFSYFLTGLGGIAYADRHGWIPVVDMKNYPNAYLFPKEVGKKNAWEYFFQQPTKCSLEEALDSKNAILGSGMCPYKFPSINKQFFYNKDGELAYWRAICKKYIKLSKDVSLQLAEAEKIFEGKRKILAVSCRGTDYTAMRPKGHPVQPDASMVIEKAVEAMEKMDYKYVYLATEDRGIAEAFKEKFGELLLIYDKKYVDYDPAKEKWVTQYSTGRLDDKHTQGMEYLVSKLLITKCDGFVTTITSGTVGIMCMADDFEYLYVFDLGYYP